MTTIAISTRACAVLWPTTFTRVTGSVSAKWFGWRLRFAWRQLAEACQLARGHGPVIRQIRSTWPYVHVVVRPGPGQTRQDFDDSAEALRVATGAHRLRVEDHKVRDVELIFTIGDELKIPFESGRPASVPDLSTVTVGRTEWGAPWRLAIGPHTLVAGCSGAGKGSVFWSFAFGLAPAVWDGRVQLHGIDLKGGMEILMGRPLFATAATDPRSAVESLEALVDLMRTRHSEYAGRIRSHVATSDAPLHLVMIDELAALTAYSYSTDRELLRRAEIALNLLCSQGRATGFMVFACLQDPRKEVIPARGLFTQMVGLRLKDLAETVMVLGEIGPETGAHCHRIPRDLPGTAYVLPEGGGAPMRVRAGYASDEAIRAVSAAYASSAVDVPA